MAFAFEGGAQFGLSFLLRLRGNGPEKTDFVLPQQGNSILVSQDDAPTLFVVSSMPALMQAFSALDGKYLGVISDLSGVPWEIFGL